MAFRKHELGLELLLYNKLGKGLNIASGQVHRFASQVNVISAKAAFGASNVISGQAKLAGVAVAGILANAAIESVKSFGEIEKKWLEVTTLIPESTEKALGETLTGIKKFARESGQGLQSSISAAYQSISAGISQEMVDQFLESANKLARGGVTDMTTAVNAITTALNAYNLEIDETDRVMDSMFTTVRLGKVTMSGLAPAIGAVLPLASELGVSFEEVSASIASMTKAGATEAEAVTRLRSSLVGLIDPGEDLSVMFAQLGLNVKDFLKENTLFELFQEIDDYAKLMGVEVSDSFGRVEGGLAALVLKTEESADLYAEHMRTMEGATQDSFEKMEKATKTGWEKIGAHLEQAKIETGEIIWGLATGWKDTWDDLSDDTEESSETIANTWENTVMRMEAAGRSAVIGNYDFSESLKEVGQNAYYGGQELITAETKTKAVSEEMERAEGRTKHFADQLDRMNGKRINVELNVTATADAMATSLIWGSGTMRGTAEQVIGYQNFQRGQAYASQYSQNAAGLAAGAPMMGGGAYGDTGPTLTSSRIASLQLTGGNPGGALATNVPWAGGGGGGESAFDVEAVMYEFGVMAADEFLAILNARLAEAGGMLTEAGAEIQRNIISVQEDIAGAEEDALADVEAQKAHQQEIEDFMFRQKMITDENYLQILHERAMSVEQYSSEHMGLLEQISAILDDRIAAENDRLAEAEAAAKAAASESDRVEDARYQLGDVTDSERISTLRDRIEEEGRLSQKGVQAQQAINRIQERQARAAEAARRAAERRQREEERKQKQLADDRRMVEDLRYEFGETTFEEYMEVLRDRLDQFGGKYTREGSTVFRKMTRLLESLNDKEKEVIEVKLDIDTNDALLVRADTVRHTTRREANRRGKPLTVLPVS